MDNIYSIIDNMCKERKIDRDSLALILENNDSGMLDYLSLRARNTANQTFGNKIYIRGLIEFTNYCHNNCNYCGIRRDNKDITRYRLNKEDILLCTDIGYELGFRTFVLQGGEDAYYNDDYMCDIIASVKKKHSDCALTLSIGEKSKETYKKYYDAGADRYLLRHETADKNHYKMLHPANMSYDNRIRCLYNLKEIGFQTGCGFMVGSFGQNIDTIYKDLQLIMQFKPHMVGIGPFIAQHNTPFADKENGSVILTLKLLAIIRILLPKVLLPATTALQTMDEHGHEKGILFGANVIMPNLSPMYARKNYTLYDNKAYSGEEAAESIELLKKHLNNIGYEISVSRGDYNE